MARRCIQCGHRLRKRTAVLCDYCADVTMYDDVPTEKEIPLKQERECSLP